MEAGGTVPQMAALSEAFQAPEDGAVGDDDVADGLVLAVEAALDRLMGTRWGDRHRHLGAKPEEVALILLGEEPPDDRDGWQALSCVVRGMILNDLGVVLGFC